MSTVVIRETEDTTLRVWIISVLVAIGVVAIVLFAFYAAVYWIPAEASLTKTGFPRAPKYFYTNGVVVTPGTMYVFRSEKTAIPSSSFVLQEAPKGGKAVFVINGEMLIFDFLLSKGSSFTIHAGELYFQCESGRYFVRFPDTWVQQ